jgi:hypothetical protein
MNKWVYLPSDIAVITAQEDTSVSITGTGQFCDCQSLTQPVAAGLPQGRCPFGYVSTGSAACS